MAFERYPHLPNSFKLGKIHELLDAKKRLILKNLLLLSDALIKKGFPPVYIRGSSVVQFAQFLMKMEAIEANDIDPIIDLDFGDAKNMDRSNFDKILTQHGVVLNSQKGTFDEYRMRDNTGEPLCDIIVTLQGYRSTNSIPLTSSRIYLKNKCLHFDKKTLKENEIAHRYLIVIFPKASDPNARHFISCYLKWINKNPPFKVFLYTNDNLQRYSNESFRFLLLNYLREKFFNLNPSAGLHCYASMKKCIEQKTFITYKAYLTIETFCLAVLERYVSSAYPRDKLYNAARNMTCILQDFYKKFPQLSEKFYDIIQYLLKQLDHLSKEGSKNNITLRKLTNYYKPILSQMPNQEQKLSTNYFRPLPQPSEENLQQNILVTSEKFTTNIPLITLEKKMNIAPHSNIVGNEIKKSENNSNYSGLSESQSSFFSSTAPLVENINTTSLSKVEKREKRSF